MPVSFGPFTLDAERRCLLENGVRIHLSPKAFDLLNVLVGQRPNAVSKQDLQARVWPDTFVQEANLGVLVSELRSVLHENGRRGRYIRTVHGFGYAFDAEAIEDPPPAASTENIPSESRRRPGARAWPWLGLAATLGVVAVATAIVVRWQTGAREPGRNAIRLMIDLPADMPLAPAGLVSPAHDRPALALSRDVGLLAYVALVEGRTAICVRDMRTGETKRLEHTDGGHTPFFSPDAAQLAFFADHKLKIIPSGGGLPKVVADAPNPWGGSWGSHGTIVFTAVEGDGIVAVPQDGGAVSAVVGGLYYMPETLGVKGVLASDVHGTWFFESRNLSRPTFVVNGRHARCLDQGILVYAAGSRIEAVRFDPEAAKVTGEPVTVAEGLRTAPYSVAQFTVSEDGTLVYVAGTPQQRARFVWVDREGRTTPFDGLPEGDYGAYALSSDGQRLAYSEAGAIWVSAPGQDRPRRISPRTAKGLASADNYPLWTPDGRGIIYTSRSLDAPDRLVLAPSDGSGAPRDLWRASPEGPRWLYAMQAIDGGRTLVAFGPLPPRAMDLFLLPLQGQPGRGGRPNTVRTLMASPFSEMCGQVSPDGRWLLFASDRDGESEIFVTSYPVPGRLTKVSKNGGREPMWNPASAEIVYARGLSMVAVPFTAAPEFQAGEPRVLFTGAFPDITGFGYQMSRDGRFLMLQKADFLEPATRLNVVTNVIDLVRGRAAGVPH